MNDMRERINAIVQDEAKTKALLTAGCVMPKFKKRDWVYYVHYKHVCCAECGNLKFIDTKSLEYKQHKVLSVEIGDYEDTGEEYVRYTLIDGHDTFQVVEEFLYATEKEAQAAVAKGKF